jgi:hypothetical protein
MLTVDLSPLPPGALLVRLPASGPGWITSVPALPRDAGAVVTATVSHPSLARVPTDELVARGYRIAGIVPGPLDLTGDAVDLLIPAELREHQPAWWSELAGRAERAFDLDLGPVRVLLAPSLAAHLERVATPVR